jgi:hypothetical protein
MTYDDEIKELHEIGVVKSMLDADYFVPCAKQQAERRTQWMLACSADVEHMAISLKWYSILRQAQEIARPIRINKIIPADLSLTLIKGR